MVVIYMVKKQAAVIRLSGSRQNAYNEMYNLRDVGYQPVNKAEYERAKKALRTPQRASTS